MTWGTCVLMLWAVPPDMSSPVDALDLLGNAIAVALAAETGPCKVDAPFVGALPCQQGP